MATSSEAADIAGARIPALAAKWQAWAKAQVGAVQAQLDTVAAERDQLKADLAQALADHAEEMAALQAALEAADPPALATGG